MPAALGAALGASLPAAPSPPWVAPHAGAVDAQLVWWGLDMYAWRQDGADERLAVSNTTRFALYAAAAHRQPRAAVHAPPSTSSRLLLTMPIVARDGDTSGLDATGAVAAGLDPAGATAHAPPAHPPAPPPSPPNAPNVDGADLPASFECYGLPTLPCNGHGVCGAGGCACAAGFVDENCTMRRACASWDGAASTYATAGCRYVGSLAGGAAAACECDAAGGGGGADGTGSGAIALDFAVLSDDLTAPIPTRGCMDPAAATYNSLADVPHHVECL